MKGFMMKNLLGLVTLTLFILSGCGSSGSSTTNESSSSSSQSTSKYDGTKWNIRVVPTTKYDKDGDRCSTANGRLSINNGGKITLDYGINGYGDRYIGEGTIKEDNLLYVIAKNDYIKDRVTFAGSFNSNGTGSGTGVSETYGCKGNWSATLIEGSIGSESSSNVNNSATTTNNIVANKTWIGTSYSNWSGGRTTETIHLHFNSDYTWKATSRVSMGNIYGNGTSFPKEYSGKYTISDEIIESTTTSGVFFIAEYVNSNRLTLNDGSFYISFENIDLTRDK